MSRSYNVALTFIFSNDCNDCNVHVVVPDDITDVLVEPTPAELFMTFVRDARLLSSWIAENQHQLNATVEEPWVTLASDTELQQFVDRHVQSTWEDIRDDTLFNFSDANDLRLVMQQAKQKLHLKCNVCLNGTEYISKNSCRNTE